MRRINYDEFIGQLRIKSLRLYTRWAAPKDRPLLYRKSRDPEEDAALFLLDRKRWQDALASGRIEKLGPRRYRWRG
ncbi:MAG: hypothetical protein ACYC0Q_09750 [Eubacteriales bacterium]